MAESYVERWKREREQKKAAAEKKERRKAQRKKEVAQDGKDTRGEGHEAQEAAGR